MQHTHDKTIVESIARHIKTSRKQVSVLFTDIEYSTMLWDIRGDIEGRLMVDKHNRLLFPVVRAHRGRVLKTIGDLLGHRSTESTCVYLQLHVEDLRDVALDLPLAARTEIRR